MKAPLCQDRYFPIFDFFCKLLNIRYAHRDMGFFYPEHKEIYSWVIIILQYRLVIIIFTATHSSTPCLQILVIRRHVDIDRTLFS